MESGLRDILKALPWVIRVALVFGATAFGWSLLGFLSPITPQHFHEYTPVLLAWEVGGHVLFGLVAAAPTLDPSLALLCGAESIAIDSDHILAALDLPVEGRLAHSVSFALVAPILLSYLTRGSRGSSRGVPLVTLSAIADHMSFDVFAGNGVVPLLSPFSLAYFDLPYWTWVPLEALAVFLAAIIRLRGRSSEAAQVQLIPKDALVGDR